MKKYKIKYVEGDTINKVSIVEAENLNNALVIFQLENLNISDITSVEEVTNE